MAAKAQPRSGRHTRRRTRHDGPAWAEKYPDTPEGFDAMHSEGEARRLPPDTDPDTIDDPDVRDAFLQRMMADDPDDKGDSAPAEPSTPRGKRPAAAPAPRTSRAPGRPSSAPTPTLRPPSRLSASDGTGFMLGLVLYAVGLNYLRYGWPGVTGWLGAKFINKPANLTPVDLSPASTAPAPFGPIGGGAFGGGRF